MIEKIYQNVLDKAQIIHCISNAVTANDLANVLLAVGSSPIMAEAIEEVEEVTAQSAGLNLNLGVLSHDRLEAMCMAGKTANRLSLPLVIDLVGIGVSAFRSQSAQRLLRELKPSVLRGNWSEFQHLLERETSTSGVDAPSVLQTDDDLQRMGERLRTYAEAQQTICALSGQVDILASANQIYFVRNGVAKMRQITGSGCMLSGLNTAFLAANREAASATKHVSMSVGDLEASVTAFCLFGLCGEKAFEHMVSENKGSGSYRTYLIDALSLTSAAELKQGAQYERYI